MTTKYTRKDKQCQTRILAKLENDRLLVEATWGKDNRNIVVLPVQYFESKYGVKV